MGRLIVFEGIDGSGKSTQFDLLCRRFSADGRSYMKLRFPRYDKPSSALIKMYLGGELGDNPNAVNAYASSSFYAVDRFASYLQDWRGYYENGGLILTDRDTTSNAIHQGAKMPPEHRERFFSWLYDFEFNLMGLPQPDAVVFLSIDAEIAARRLKNRQSQTGDDRDIHEKDMAYLMQCAQCGRQAADLHGWHTVMCNIGERELCEAELHDVIYTYVNSYDGQQTGRQECLI